MHNNNKENFSPSYYVYTYINPENNKIFYVGIGTNTSDAVNNLYNKSEKEKHKKIEEITSKGKTPIIKTIVYGLDSKTALKVQKEILDLIQ